jgi:hypothetical protein
MGAELLDGEETPLGQDSVETSASMTLTQDKPVTGGRFRVAGIEIQNLAV